MLKIFSMHFVIRLKISFLAPESALQVASRLEGKREGPYISLYVPHSQRVETTLFYKNQICAY